MVPAEIARECMPLASKFVITRAFYRQRPPYTTHRLLLWIFLEQAFYAAAASPAAASPPSRQAEAAPAVKACLGLQKTGSKYGNLLKGPRSGPKPHAAASLRPPGSHLVRVAGWHLELLSGRPGRDEDLTASGRPPMSG